MFLGIDIGSSSVKATLFDGQRFYTFKTVYTDLHDSREQDPHRISATVAETVRKARALVPGSGAEIEGIGLSGHGPSVVFINGKGEPVSALLTWQDNRAVEEARELRSRIPHFYKDGSSFEAKLLWFFRHRPECFREGCTALYPKDYIFNLFCEKRIVDSSTASTFAFYRRDTGEWIDSYIDFPETVLPEVRDPWEAAGVTSTAFSGECGLPDGIPVYPGGIDAYCGAVGAGGVAPNLMVEETGTSTCVSRCFSDGSGADQHVLPGFSITMKTLSYTGGSCQWFLDIMRRTGMAECLYDTDPEDPVNILFIPYLLGERSPVWDEKAMGAYIGLRNSTDERDLFRATLQGTAFAIYQNLLLLEEFCGTADAIHAVGGGACNSAWLQMKANISGRVYRQMKEIDAASIGAALIAAVGGGSIRVGDIPSLIRVERIFTPARQAHSRYEKLFELYSGMYERLKPVFHALYDV